MDLTDEKLKDLRKSHVCRINWITASCLMCDLFDTVDERENWIGVYKDCADKTSGLITALQEGIVAILENTDEDKIDRDLLEKLLDTSGWEGSN